MSTFIALSFSLVVIGLVGWTITTYLVKEGSQQFIKEELANLLDICKMFFVSLKSLIGILVKYSFSSDSIEETPDESCGIDAKSLEVVDSIETVEATETIPSIETHEEDDLLSSFSPELVDVITEEEEKVA